MGSQKLGLLIMKAMVVGVPGDVIYTISLIMYMVPIGKLVVDGATYM